MKTIGLIAGKSGDSLTDELHKRGHLVALVCKKEYEPGYNKADLSLLTDLRNREEIYYFFVSNNVTEVVIGTGHELAFDVAEYLSKRDIITNIDLDKSKLAKDKYQFKKEVERIGIKTPNFILVESLDQLMDISKDITIPCVVKSTIDTVEPCKVNNLYELKEAIVSVLNTNSKALVEEYIDGNDCTVAVISDGLSIRSLGVTYYSKAKSHNLKGFENSRSVEMAESEEQRICGIAEKIVKELNFRGVVRIDLIISDSAYVLELNSVQVTGYSGQLPAIFKKQGINIASVFIDTALSLMGVQK